MPLHDLLETARPATVRTMRLLAFAAALLVALLGVPAAAAVNAGPPAGLRVLPRVGPPGGAAPVFRIGGLRRIPNELGFSHPVGYADNWCGYAARGSRWTSVTATWTQPTPQVNGTSTYEWSCFWVGLDGDFSQTVEQIGTDAYTADGSVFYEAWYEMYPANSVVIPVAVHADDELTATVTTNSAGGYTLTLTDDTTGVSYTTTQAGPTQPASAEVIAEDPGPLGNPVPLADFGTVQFTGCTFNGEPLDAFTDDEWRMQSNSGVLEAAPSLITDDSSTGTSSFSVCTARDFMPPTSPTPVISGDVVPPDNPGEELDCSASSTGVPIPDLLYQWLRDGVTIDNEIWPQYEVQDADFGHTLSCQVTATNIVGTATGSASLFVPTVPPSNTTPPLISGTPAVGETLSCSGGSWKGAPTPSFTYQWLRDGTAISDATQSSYTVQATDCGRRLTCTVTATNGAGQAAATSDSLTVAAPTLVLKVAATYVRLGKTISLSGLVRNFVAGDRTVRICRKVGAKLTLLKRLSISSSGAYRWSMKPTKPGKWMFVARYRVGGRTFAGKAVTVTVRR